MECQSSDWFLCFVMKGRKSDLSFKCRLLINMNKLMQDGRDSSVSYTIPNSGQMSNVKSTRTVYSKNGIGCMHCLVCKFPFLLVWQFAELICLSHHKSSRLRLTHLSSGHHQFGVYAHAATGLLCYLVVIHW